jgi:hypothetical protein
MKIEISANEYRDLLDLLHIADVVMSGHRREQDKRMKQHRALIQKLYAFAGSEGFDRLIGYNEHENKYTPTAEFEESSMAHVAVDEFANHLFWDQLINRLTARDAAQMMGGIERLEALNESDRHSVEAPIRQRYFQEFTTNGVANLEIVERFSIAGGAQTKTSD